MMEDLTVERGPGEAFLGWQLKVSSRFRAVWTELSLAGSADGLEEGNYSL